MIKVDDYKLAEQLNMILSQNIVENLYFYINFNKYGYHMNTEFFISEDGKYAINRYHNSISIAGDINESNVYELYEILKNNYQMISSSKKNIQTIMEYFNLNGASERNDLNKKYKVKYGQVYLFGNYKQMEHNEVIEIAGVEDMDSIAELILSAENFSSNYGINSLKNQLIERLNDKFARNFIIRDEGKIIAHIATYAEYKNIAVTSGLVVDKNYQNRMLGYILEAYLVQNLQNENFNVYTQVIARKRQKFLSAIGSKMLAEYGKMTLV